MDDSPAQPSQLPEQNSADLPRATNNDPPPSRWQERALLILMILVAIPFLFRWGHGEIAKWHLAAATDAQYRGDRVAAVAAANRAAEWDPDNSRIQSTQGSMMLSLGDAEGAARVADQVVKQHRQEYQQRASTLNHLRLAASLNQSAYSHALATTDLETALEHIKEAVAIREGLSLPRDDGYASMLDTRGYLRLLVAVQNRDKPMELKEADHDDHVEDSDDEGSEAAEEPKEPMSKEDRYQHALSKALADLESAVAIYKRALKMEQAGIENDARLVIDHVPLKFRRRSLDESMSVLLHHRGLIYEAVGKLPAAERDFKQAKQLGYDPQNGVW